MKDRKIIVVYDRPLFAPGPYWDWAAYYENDDPETRHEGRGATKEEAIKELKSMYIDLMINT